MNAEAVIDSKLNIVCYEVNIFIGAKAVVVDVDAAEVNEFFCAGICKAKMISQKFLKFCWGAHF